MAQVVLGIGHSHTPRISVDPEEWPNPVLAQVACSAFVSRQALPRLPRALRKGGTSEILNWVALDGAVGELPMTLIDYIPGYRSRPSTGCAMAFANWQ